MASNGVGNNGHAEGVSKDMDQPSFSPWQKACRMAWRIARPILIAYLMVVLVMLYFETRLVYPIPPLRAGDWRLCQAKARVG
jgi:hypothetical protein